MGDDPLCAGGTIDENCRAVEDLLGKELYTRHEIPGSYMIVGERSWATIPFSAGSLSPSHFHSSFSITFHARTQTCFKSVHPLSDMADQEDPKEGDEEQCPRSAVASALNLLMRNSAARVAELVVRVCISVPASSKCALLALDAGE
jgi:hypothetical protein